MTLLGPVGATADAGRVTTSVGRDATIDAVVAAATATDRRGVVLVGPAGVGKSFVLGRAVAALAATGSPVVHLSGDPVVAAIPFGAFRSVIPTATADPGGWAELVRAGIDHLTAPQGDRPTVVVVDDLHHFDAGSASILHQGLVAGRFNLLGSVRSAEAVPEGITRLWDDGLVGREDLRPLDRPAAEQLAMELLGGPLEGATEHRLWGWTHGNPLFLRELLASARDAGAVQSVRGLWRVRGQVAGSEGLRTLLGHRLAGCPTPVREVAEILAVADRLPARLLEQLTGPEAVADAERAGVIAVDDDDRLECRLAHPLHGEVIRHELGPELIRDRQEALLDAAVELGVAERADRMLLAVWYLETQRESDDAVELLGDAARSAWRANDSLLATRLARRAWELGGEPAIGLLLCEALLRQGAGDEMIAVAELLLAGAGDDDALRARAVSYVASAIRIWRNAPDEAIAVARRSAYRISEPEHRDTLDLLVASIRLDSGHPEEAVAITRRVLQTGSPANASAAAMTLVPALSAMGRLDEALAEADQAIAAALGSDGQTLNDLGAHLLFRVDSASMQGGLAAAVATLEPAHPAVVASGDALAGAWLALVLARVETRRGRPGQGLRWFREAVAGFTDLHRPAWEAWGQAGMAHCLSLLGRQAEAEAAAAQVVALAPWRIAFGDPDVARALAWVRVGADDLEGAIADLWAAATVAEAQVERFNEATILNDLVRLGDAEATTRLVEVSAAVPSALVAGWAARAAAWSAGSVTGLAAAAERLAAEGADVDAAEAEAAAAALARRAGDERTAAAAVQRAASLLRRCEGIATPALRAIQRPELTRREHDVARLAAAGRSRRAIADELFLSVRTVDSHLQRIYRKLGVSNTAGLTRTLPDAVGAAGVGAGPGG